ncbi:alpha/beta hydrolase [Microbacterium sp. No. 7]|uniref:alpha/beta hydrolase n=1 Tax=Microbacterium sp. No. 7 TaxID=1714373 RepID=UPI0006CFEFAF|nr:alpha/beta hydrolase [Microbacterium sp. No. 7]ALJ21456.1 alpha/beta hydrolase [Microbacterium sp. No. 7]
MEWMPDVLGDEFEQLTLPLGEDDEGEVVATLVRALPPEHQWWQQLKGERPELDDVDVLYVHGWSDYFFQKRLARVFTGRGARFHALDLRKYGRSLRPGQTPGYITDLAEYDADIAAALAAMGQPEPALRDDGGADVLHEARERLAAEENAAAGGLAGASAEGGAPEPHEESWIRTWPLWRWASQERTEQGHAGQRRRRRLILVAHSTGGLILSLWAHRHPDAADAVILNSPWLEFQLPRRGREAFAPLVELSARYRPYDRAPQIDLGFYTRAQQAVADPDDPVEVNLEWRPEQTMAVHAGWLHAVLAGHAAVAGGLDIPASVCVLLSSRFAPPTAWSDELTRVDSVLVVDDIARAALKLGPVVTVVRVDGALHDVFLSRHEAREEAYRRLGDWLTGWAATNPAPE